jgi:hypothetical protein
LRWRRSPAPASSRRQRQISEATQIERGAGFSENGAETIGITAGGEAVDKRLEHTMHTSVGTHGGNWSARIVNWNGESAPDTELRGLVEQNTLSTRDGVNAAFYCAVIGLSGLARLHDR